MARPLVIFLAGAGWEARYQATMLAVTAASFGDPVTLALAFEPLRLWAEGRFDEGAPETAAAARIAPLRETLEEARRELGLRVVACETAVRLSGIDPAAARPLLDDVTSLPALWQEARGGQVVFA